MKKILTVALIILLCASILIGCTETTDNSDPTQTKEKATETKKEATEKPAEPVEEIVITIPHYKSGQNVGGVFFLPQVERFNEMYDGKYELVIEEIPQDSYQTKIQQLAQQGKLPALIEGADKNWFEDIAIPNDMYYDLSTWLDENPELKARTLVDSLGYNTIDGKVVAFPLTVVRPIGLFYNNELFTPSKPIGELSMDELLAEFGDNKFAFMTVENAWTTSLMLTAIFAQQDGGPEILKEGVLNQKSDYTSKPFIDAFTIIQNLLQNYASSNTVGAAYADAANSFMSQSAAIIANGPWMVGDFAAESSDKWSNGFTGEMATGGVYPGNIAIANTFSYNWWIPSGLPEGETEAALAFLAFMNTPEELEAYMLAEGGTAPNLTPSDEYVTALSEKRLLSELSLAVNSDTIIIPMILDIMPGSVANEEFGKLLPKLIDGSVTPEEFATILSDKAVAALAE